MYICFWWRLEHTNRNVKQTFVSLKLVFKRIYTSCTIVQLRMSLHSYLRERYSQPAQSLVKRFEKDLHKRARYSNHHIYALRCKDEGIVPPSLWIKPPIQTKNAFRIAEKASRAFLSERIRQTSWKKKKFENKVSRADQELKWTLSNEDFQKVNELCCNSAEKTFARRRQSHLEKLEKLIKKKNVSLRPEGASKWVINRT